MNDVAYIAIDGPRPETRLSRPELEKPGAKTHGTDAIVDTKVDRSIAIVESRTFMRECMRRGMQAAFSQPVVTFSTLSELESQFSDAIALVFLCLADAGQAECANALKVLSALNPSIPIVVHATVDDVELAKTAINLGAKGYIPCTTTFEIAIEAVRFILAGGAYVPMDYLFPSGLLNRPANQAPPLSNVLQDSPIPNALTGREISIVKAVQEGKSNKIIAYKLCICEGTVKVHLRNIMKKLNAKNCTDVAIKAQTSFGMDIERAGPR